MNRLSGVGIGLDIGEKRVGMARGDADIKLTYPLNPVIVDNFKDEKLFNEIANIIRENGASFIVAGLPRNSRGEETQQSDFSRIFLSKLQAFLPKELKVYLQDESLTSVKAEENLRLRKDFRENILRDGTLDSEAAAIILSDFLEDPKYNEIIFSEKLSKGDM